MGRFRNWAHRVNEGVMAAVDGAEDLAKINQQITDLELLRNSGNAFTALRKSISTCLLVIWVFCAFWLAIVCVEDMGQFVHGNETVSFAIRATLFGRFGQIALLFFLSCMVPSIRMHLDAYERERDVAIAVKEGQIRGAAWRFAIKYVCRVYTVSCPRSLSIDQYADSIINTFAVVTSVIAPLVSIMFPKWTAFFRFSTAMGVLSRTRGAVITWFNRLFNGIRDVNSRTLAISSAVAAGLAAAGAAWLYSRQRRSRKRQSALRVVPKKKQQTIPVPEDVRPVDPSELDVVFDFISPSSLKTWPEYPSFRGCSVVEKSIVRINGLYGATCFRVGQNLITAGHCVGRNPSSSKTENSYGIPCYNADDGLVYWAPLEKYFRNPDSRMAGDGIAICSLPNADFFLSRQSVQLAVPTKNISHIGAFRTQGFRGPPTYTFSVSPATVEDHVTSYKASVEPGSSGGPVINVDGSVVCVTVAQSPETNYGMNITKEIVDFLRNSGDAQQSKSVCTPGDQSSTESTEIDSSSESSESEDEIPKKNGHGQVHQEEKKKKKSKSSIGATPKESKTNQKHYMRRKPKKNPEEKPSPPPPEGHIES